MTQKTAYQAPQIEVIQFATETVLTPSSPDGGSSSDGNQGEWDPQPKQNTQKMNLF